MEFQVKRAITVGPMLMLLFWLAASAVGQTTPADSLNYSRRVWQSADGLPEDFAQSLARTRDGYLWIGTSGGLVRFDGVRFTVFNRENQPAFRDDSFYALFVAQDGTLWGGTEGGGLMRYRHGSFRIFGAAELGAISHRNRAVGFLNPLPPIVPIHRPVSPIHRRHFANAKLLHLRFGLAHVFDAGVRR